MVLIVYFLVKTLQWIVLKGNVDPYIQHGERLNSRGSFFAPFGDERLPLISSCLAEVDVAMGFEKVCCSKNLQIFL